MTVTNGVFEKREEKSKKHMKRGDIFCREGWDRKCREEVNFRSPGRRNRYDWISCWWWWQSKSGSGDRWWFNFKQGTRLPHLFWYIFLLIFPFFLFAAHITCLTRFVLFFMFQLFCCLWSSESDAEWLLSNEWTLPTAYLIKHRITQNTHHKFSLQRVNGL